MSISLNFLHFLCVLWVYLFICDYEFLDLGLFFVFLFSKGDNLGFAFVNFTTASGALKIKEALQDYKWGEFCIPNGNFTSKKILDITWAKIQVTITNIILFNSIWD